MIFVICTGITDDATDQYIVFSHIYDEVVTEKGRTREAIQEIIRRCKEQDILADYIGEEEAIEAMYKLFDYKLFDQEKAIKSMRREDREEGKKEGREEGIWSCIQALMELPGVDLNSAMDMLEISQNERETYLKLYNQAHGIA